MHQEHAPGAAVPEASAPGLSFRAKISQKLNNSILKNPMTNTEHVFTHFTYRFC